MQIIIAIKYFILRSFLNIDQNKTWNKKSNFRTQAKLKKRVTDLLNERTIMQKRFLMEEVHGSLRDLLGELIKK